MADDTAPTPDPIEGPGKGEVYFNRAKTVASTGNFDYAIDLYIEGLNREPFNLAEHKQLREFGFQRKVAGGRAPGGLFGAKGPYKGKTPKEAMLNGEYLLAKDIGNFNYMILALRNAAALNLAEVATWFGQIAAKALETIKSPKKETFREVADLLAKVEAFDSATNLMEFAKTIWPTDAELDNLSKDYAAKATIKRGRFDKGENFKGSLNDAETTKKLLQEENLAKSVEHRTSAVDEARAAYLANPSEMQVITKYVKTLVDMDNDADENTAIDVLNKAFESTKVYRFKLTAGDVRMKQLKRKVSQLKEALKERPDDSELRARYEAAAAERAAFEIEEFRERTERFPTDLGIKFEFGRRLFESGHMDECLGPLQEAQSAPKVKVEAMYLLGRAFLELGMAPEAIDTLKRSIEEYDLASTGDARSKGLHYWYGRALEAGNKLQPAADIYSQVIRWDITYLDARKRLQGIRAKLEGATPAS